MDMIQTGKRKNNSAGKGFIFLPLVIVFSVFFLTVGVSLALLKNQTSSLNNIFSTVKTVYTLHYNANGASGSVADDTKSVFGDTDSTEFTAKDSTGLTYEGYTFLGWADSVAEATSNAAAGSAHYVPGDATSGKVTVQAGSPDNYEKTVYAVWQKNVTVTLEYDTKGGSPATIQGESYQLQPTENSKSFTVTMTDVTREGFDFKGWTDESSATTAKAEYAPGSQVTLTRTAPTLKLYAVWEENTVEKTFTLSFDANLPEGITGTNVSVPAQKGPFTATTSSYTFTEIGTAADANQNSTGLVFLGWSLSADDSTVVLEPSDTTYTTEQESTTLYAVWGYKYYLRFSRNVSDGSVGKYLRSNNTLVNNTDDDMIEVQFQATASPTTVSLMSLYDNSGYQYRRTDMF